MWLSGSNILINIQSVLSFLWDLVRQCQPLTALLKFFSKNRINGCLYWNFSKNRINRWLYWIFSKNRINERFTDSVRIVTSKKIFGEIGIAIFCSVSERGFGAFRSKTLNSKTLKIHISATKNGRDSMFGLFESYWAVETGKKYSKPLKNF